MGDVSKKGSKTGHSQTGPLGKAYLVVYNVFQLLGWSYVLYLTTDHYLVGGDISTLWSTVAFSLSIFQNLAVLEIIHVALGLVKSNLTITTFQVASRVMLVCGVLYTAPPARISPGLPLLLIAWCVSEIVRYSFYALNLVGSVPYFIIWCRYTFFYVLYPMGVTGELLCLYAAQTYAGASALWSTRLPNPLNFTFDYQYTLIGVMLLYIPLFPKMYFHMISQRRKVIGGETHLKTS